ncbi:MAG: hypothetical protein OXE85_04850 [Roseovarius sp.]|nr:hypothetical protein [Roseovarius sp.]
MLEVKQPGLETSVQDHPGCIDFLEQGFPPSGPMEAWSFRQANLLAGNSPGTVGLECRFLGPTLPFHKDGAMAITGADIGAPLDDTPIAAHETVYASPEKILEMSGARIGARSCLAASGGLVAPEVQGPLSTFHMTGLGGVSEGGGNSAHWRGSTAAAQADK